ncbi:MAG: metal ABC transporter permease [Xanthobacteraceae bacterium]
MFNFFVAPFADDAARHALVAMLALALGAGPADVFLMLRRMALMGDTMSHAILPGVAVAVAVAGLDMFAMTVGGIVAGLVVALLAGLVARTTQLKEDSSLAAFFLISLALGIVILSATGRDEEILHVLFGNMTALDNKRLILIAAISTISMIGFALIWRPLVIECVDPQFLRSVSSASGPVHYAFLALVVLNLVAAFQALGTLLAVGLMMLPAVTARFWARDITMMVVAAILTGILAGYIGLLVSFHTGVAAGPAVILVAGAIYVGSVLFGPVGGVLRQAIQGRHLEA